MPFDCQFRSTHGQDACVDDCPTTGPAPTFVFARVERPSDLPEIELKTIDVAVLDMHHGWPNLGHDAIGYGIQNIVCDITPALRRADLRVRVLSYDVRRGQQIPAAPDDRHGIYIGTGGPGHLDPRLNDGVSGDPRVSRRIPRGSPGCLRCSTRFGPISRRRSLPCVTPSASCAGGLASRMSC